MVSLLPSNATPLEQALEAAFRSDLDANALCGFKFRPEAMPFIFEDLVAEYGLGPVRLWIQDAAEVLKEGVLFQRLRGTPAAIKMALRWTGLQNVVIEEEPVGAHFAEFQLGLEGLPADLSIEAIFALADMAKPARARLTRLYNSLYDRRHLVLDANIYGDFLSGYSGVWVGDLQVSFGRQESYAAHRATASEQKHATLCTHLQTIWNRDIFRLDEGILDEEQTELFDPGFVHEHAFIFAVIGGVGQEAIRRTAHCLAKSQLVLSDGFTLGAENTALGAFWVEELGQLFQLDADTLSNHAWKRQRAEILERFLEERAETAAYGDASQPQSLGSRERQPVCTSPGSTATAVQQRHSLASTAAYTGVLLWHDHVHLDRPWGAEQPIVVALTR